MVVRRVVGIAAALGALIIAFVAGTGSAATATQGQAVIAGEANGATDRTLVANSTFGGTALYGQSQEGTGLLGTSVAGASTPTNVGVLGLSAAGIVTEGSTWPGDGVHGHGATNGVSGLTGNGGASGVYGQNDGGGYGVAGRSTAGIGVFGQALGAADGVDGLAANSCCSAVYGLNTGAGNGVAGRADTGTGVLAASTGGIGLKVDGKAQFSRAGTATVTGTTAAPKSSIRINNVALSFKSLVFTTPQKNVGGVWIQSAVPNVAGSSVTIYLNKAVTVSYPIAWFIVERP
jgi:hypothetical protein